MQEDYSCPMEILLGARLRKLSGPILITGHTGFKGTWLTFLLQHLNVSTVGYSLPPTPDSLYDRANLIGKIPEIFGDIRDKSQLTTFIRNYRPSAIIHMAAQPLVLESYKTPRETFEINTMGTVNVLDAAFETDFVKAVIVVTTDKVYRNDNSGRAFIESDPLEGKDPYSASKVAAEAVVSGWQQIAKVSGGPKVTSVRAGNVIGGGDWAVDRLIPDLVRGFISGIPTQIRNPESTRPWQHVLDPLIGYLMTLENLLDNKTIKSLNFAPEGKSLPVQNIAEYAVAKWSSDIDFELIQNRKLILKESINLDLNPAFAQKELGWIPLWTQLEAVDSTIQWWKQVILAGANPEEISIEEIAKIKFNIK